MRWLWRKILDLKISYKLMGIYLIVTAIPLIFVGAYLNLAMRDVMLNNAIFETESNLDKIEIQLETVLNRMTHISDLIYLSRDMDDLLNTDYESTLDMYNAYSRYPIVEDYIKYYDEIDNIQFYMKRPMITNSHFIHASVAFTEEEWYQQAVDNQGRISWMVKREHWTNERFLTLTRSVYDQENQLLGVLAIYLSTDKLKEMVDSEIHDVFIILDEQEIVYNRDDNLMYRYPGFISAVPEQEDPDNILFDHRYRGEDVKVNLHRLKPNKTLVNEFQIATIIPVESLMEEPNQIFNRGYWMMVGALAISIVAFQIFIKIFNSRIKTLKMAMAKVAHGTFNIKPAIAGKDEIGEAYDELYRTSQSIQQLIDEVYVHKIKEERWRRQQKESEFKMLSSQINPHFLYNTLEMIRMKAIVNKDKEVAVLIQKLSKMMRSALERTDRPIPLVNEIEIISTYLEIQVMRFGNKLTYTIDIDEQISSCRIFPLLIQPLIENAIIHGLEAKEGMGNLQINAFREQDCMKIVVQDDGVGMSNTSLAKILDCLDEGEGDDGKKIGIRNVHQRIQLYYGKVYGLQISSQLNQGTIVTLTLPIVK
ncbi:cache domain-containing sensor histidine kinase [Amphibacillus jilinensis]|uniref:cache domain-containing sensor histidine kinase n=1 Tax=Amphibacillus jilinensis TaxID=1216008 RepID=UPI0002FC9721|nr:sensor histidine kinase [Amphibacillus jilinensis]